MSKFLLLYFSVYLLMHVYAFFHAYRSLGYGRKMVAGTALFSVFMVLSPIIVRVAENDGFETGPRLLAYIGYTWMGLLFLFIAVAVFYDVFAVGKWLFLTIRRKPAAMTADYRRKRFVTQLVIVLSIYCYGLYEANHIRTVHITITSPNISARIGKFRIAQISDVHLGLIVREGRLKKILEKVEESRPDLLVSTGDLVDGQMNDLRSEEKLLAEVNPPFGKLAVTGNHEFYAGLDQALEFTNKAGFLVLRNQAINVNGIAFVGVDDQVSGRTVEKKANTESSLLQRQKRGTFTVLLKHRPVVDQKSVGLFDIQLSGHVHGGQIFPFTFLTRYLYGYSGGLNPLDYGYLYISNGSGTWGPPIRFLAPPEVTVIDLVHGA